jgi:protein CpxP
MIFSQANSFSKWLITILVVINIIALVIIWILVGKEKAPPDFNRGKHPPDPVSMMKKELNLTNEQVLRYEKLSEEYFNRTENLRNDLNITREKIVNEMFKYPVDTAAVNLLSLRIGEIETKMERFRFEHFSKISEICSADQREKLKDILIRMALRKPPPDRPGPPKPMNERKNY